MDTSDNQYFSWIRALLLGLFFFVILSCSNPSETEVEVGRQLLGNCDVEAGATEPTFWSSYAVASSDTVYEFEWTDEEAFSPSRSLKIELDYTHGWRDGARWRQTILVNPGSFGGNDLLLECAIMKKNISGNGAVIYIFTKDAQGISLQGATKADDWVNNESRYWYTTSLRLKNLSNRTRRISVYLGLQNNTKGIIYFDDITLTVLK